MNPLPLGWASATLGDVTEVVSGSTPRTGEPSYWGGSIAWITPDDLSKHQAKRIALGKRTLTEAGYASCSTQLVPPGTVLYTSRAPIGYVAIAAGPVCTNQGFKSFVPAEGIESDYLYWFLRHATPEIRKLGSGTTFPELSKKGAQAVVLPVPPLGEQRRIVAAIEEQFSRLDAAHLSLGRADRGLVPLSRQVGNRLSDESWPTQELRDVVDVLDAQRVPVNRKERASRPGDVPYYGATGQVGWIDEPLFNEELVLLGEDGAPFLDPAKPKSYIIHGPAWVNNHAHVLRPRKHRVIASFLKLALDRFDYRAVVKGTTVPKLTQRGMNSIVIPVPGIDEQRNVMDEFERQTTLIDSLRTTIDLSRQRSAHLRRAVLERAFRGELVPQDPSDEPASLLLERIRAERAAAAKAKRRKRVTA